MKLILKSAVLLCVLLLLAGSGFGGNVVKQTEKEKDKTLSPYFLVKSDDKSTDQLPLKSTSADVSISGVIADVKVTQVYKNEGKKPIEAIYVFPASTKAAVYGMKMTIGKRTIIAKINKREEARKQYEEAKKQGKSASLLEQQRPNVFQMNVANIMPGDLIKVELSYTELITPEDKVYEFVYPTVTGPRYSNQPAATADPKEKWVANPYTHQGEAPLYTFNISVNLNTGLPVRDIKCDSHKVNVAYDGPTTAFVKLDGSEAAGGNRDFILKYRLDGDKIDSGLLLYKGEKENFFLLMMQSPRKLETKNIPGREYVFIVDVSGSMHGFPLEISKTLLRDLIGNLRPTDMFNVLLFSGGSKLMSERSVPATAENIEQALNVINNQQGGGGTELLPALKRTLAIPRSKGFSRSVIIVTDGYVTVEPEVFDLMRSNLGDANMFTFGIGSSVNRHLLEGMARVGMGEPFIISQQSEAAEKAARFRSLVQNPALTNIKIDFGKFDVYDVEPISVPDIMADRPVIVFGKWRGTPKGTITLRGVTGKGAHKETINVGRVKPSDTNTALKYLWARHKITLISDYIGRQTDKKRIEEVTRLGLDYNLLTKYTSFVAIDSEIRNKTGDSATIKQPLPMPQGVSDYAVGGYTSSPAPMSPAVRYKSARRYEGTRNGYAPEEYSEKITAAKKGMYVAKQDKAFVEKIDVSDKAMSAVVRKIVNDNSADLKKCNTANLHGKMVVKFVISADGKVKSVRVVTDGIKNLKLKKSITNAIAKWMFPGISSSGSLTATVTLNF